MDDNQIDSNPQQYREEWFNVAVSVGKEFELPNVSSTLMNNWLTDHNKSKSQIQTDAASDVATNTIGTNHTSIVRSVSSPKSDLILTKNQQSHVPFPSNEQTLAPVIVNPTDFHPSSRSNKQSPSISSTVFSNQNLKRSLADANEMNPSSDPIRPSSISRKNKEILVSNDQYSPIKPKQEVQDSVEFNPPEQLHAERKSNTCFHKLTMQIEQSKTNEKMKENNEIKSDFKGDHECFVCNVTFATGNALGGHMSSHAKRKKMQVMRDSGLSIFKSDETFSKYVVEQGYKNDSNQPPNESLAATDDSTSNTDEKIEGNESSKNQKAEKSTKGDAQEEDGLKS